MKFKLTGNFAITVLITTYIAIVVCFYVLSSYVPPPEQPLSVADNLQTMHLMQPDTAKYIDSSKSTTSPTTYFINRNLMMYGQGGTTVALIGTTSGSNCIVCDVKHLALRPFEDNIANLNYYIKLPYWKIKQDKSGYWHSDSVRFHLENGHGYIRRAIKEREIEQANGQYCNAYLVDVLVKFRYDEKNECLLIPVSKLTKNIVDPILIVSLLCLVTVFFYLVACFLKFAFDLSKGFAFTDENILRLKVISLLFIFYPVVGFFLNLLMKLIFHNYFTADVIMSKAIWVDAWKPIGVGLIFLLLYRAFKQGKLLKDEQDLTV